MIRLQLSGQFARSCAALRLLLCVAAFPNLCLAAEAPATRVKLTTSDGVVLFCTYWPSARGKEAAPIVLLHSEGANRSTFQRFGQELQHIGHAVLSVDLRGHGESTHTLQGEQLDLLNTMRPDDVVEQMATRDLRRVREFLTIENNAGRLNLEALSVVAIERSTIVAMRWIINDWNPPADDRRASGGKNIKAMALLSPPFDSEMTDLLEHPDIIAQQTLIIVGKENAAALAAADQVHRTLHANRPPINDGVGEQSLFIGRKEVSEQGARLLEKQFLMDRLIAQFIQARVVRRQEEHYRWSPR